MACIILNELKINSGTLMIVWRSIWYLTQATVLIFYVCLILKVTFELIIFFKLQFRLLTVILKLDPFLIHINLMPHKLDFTTQIVDFLLWALIKLDFRCHTIAHFSLYFFALNWRLTLPGQVLLTPGLYLSNKIKTLTTVVQWYSTKSPSTDCSLSKTFIIKNSNFHVFGKVYCKDKLK